MHKDASRPTLLALALASIVIVVALFYWQGRTGISLSDEGFLWYGAQRTLDGDVPIRDFMAYDPARYYWVAAIMRLAGDNGIVTTRLAVALVQAIGLFVALLIVARSIELDSRQQGWALITVAAAVLALWMLPRHKLFDTTVSIVAVGVLVLLVERPSLARAFAVGAMVGLLATIGRNHGLYAACASVGLIIYLRIGRNAHPMVPLLAAWAAGIVVGYLPVLAMLVTVPDFATAFGDSIRLLWDYGATNIPLPVPWPWRSDLWRPGGIETLRGIATGVLFCLLLAYGVLGIGYAIRQKRRIGTASSAIVATSFAALPYAHYAFSRADIGHLALGIFPFLIGGFVVLGRMRPALRIGGALAMLAAALLVALPQHPGWQALRNPGWIETTVLRDRLTIDAGVARDIAMLARLDAVHAGEGRTFYAAPYWPGAYAVLERKAPTWEIYALIPRSESFQRAEIERLERARPGFVVILDHALDGHDQRRFRNTHPLIDHHIRESFEPLPGTGANELYRVYIRRPTT